MSESRKRGKSNDASKNQEEVSAKMLKPDDNVATSSATIGNNNDASLSVTVEKNKEADKSKDNNDDDDDLFGELSGTVNRVVVKPNALEIGVKYQVVEMYTVKVDGRVAIIGKLTREDSIASVYVWLPSSLTRNITESDVPKLNAKLQQGKKAYSVYSGTIPNKYGQETYVMDWVKK